LGGVSAGGVGTPEFDVTHRGGGPCAFVAIQSGGSVGGVTPSKFSFNVSRVPQNGHGGVGDGLAAARISTLPQPEVLFGGPGVPQSLYARKCAPLSMAVRLDEML
jgi:hypothetical protein